MVTEQEIIDRLKEEGFTGFNLCDVMEFAENKTNEYWVDIPVKLRNAEEKTMAEKCNKYKKLILELKQFAKTNNFNFVYDSKDFCYKIKNIS